jgi:hypothetical protein
MLETTKKTVGNLDVCYDDAGTVYDIEGVEPVRRMEPRWAKKELQKEARYILLR